MVRTSWIAIALALSAPALAAETPGDDTGPLIKGKVGEFTYQVPISVSAFAENASAYTLDKDGTQNPSGLAIAPRLRLGLTFDSGAKWTSLKLQGAYEQDVVNGYKDLRDSVDGIGMPYSTGLAPQLRKAYLRAVVNNAFVVGAGVMSNYWGLGLLANDGAHGWTPGSARFTEPRGGDRVLRAMVSTVPFTSAGVMVTAGFDRAWGDPILLTAADIGPDSKIKSDTAYQGVAALTFGYQKPTNGGVYAVYRRQTTDDGRFLHAFVVDGTASTVLKFGETKSLSLGVEGVFVSGKTDFAATPDYKEQDVRQLGVAARAGLDLGKLGSVVDFLYASGDQNSDDGAQNGFKANPNYHMGLLLFRQVLAAQSGRAALNAGNPELVGLPSQGLDRAPARGQITNTFSVFPRVWVRPTKGLEVYGGALFAMTAVPLVDPLNTRLAGGVARNSLNGVSGRYLGTEADLGVRYELPINKTSLGLGLEGGVLVPGSALNDASGSPMGTVTGGRLIVDYRL